MIILLYIFLAILGYVYLYSIGVYFVAKKLGYNKPEKVFIPFYSFKVMSNLIGTFSIFTIPVKKYFGTMLILIGVILLACLYALWGNTHLPEISAESLWQIMGVVIGISVVSIYACFLSSTTQLFLKFKLERTGLLTFLTALVLPIPFVYIYLSKKELRIL